VHPLPIITTARVGANPSLFAHFGYSLFNRAFFHSVQLTAHFIFYHIHLHLPGSARMLNIPTLLDLIQFQDTITVAPYQTVKSNP